MVLPPREDIGLDLFADADFAGLWNAEDPQDPTCVRSRTGYVVTLGSAPVTWGSKLQTKIALSTTEAEYSSLSHSMRVFIPIRRMFLAIADVVGVKPTQKACVSRVWEDNNACLKMATDLFPTMTPRTKHFAVEYHWFREHMKEGEIEAKRIDTDIQLADIFTKGLKRQEFEKKRKLLMKW